MSIMRGVVRGVVVTTAVAALAIVAVAASEPRRSPSYTKAFNEARAWAKGNRDKLPKTMSDFGKLPIVYRRAIQIELTMFERASIWREQLTTYLLPLDQLTPMQREMRREVGELSASQLAVISAARDSLSMVFDTVTYSKKEREAIADRLCARAKAVLTPLQMDLVFATPGLRDLEFERMTRPPVQVQQASMLGAPLALAREAALKLGIIKVEGCDETFASGGPASTVRPVGSRNRANSCCTCHVGSLCQMGCTSDTCLVPPSACCGCFGIWTCNGRMGFGG